MSDLSNAIKQICEEKGLSYEAVLSTIESALSAAYRKDFGKKNQNIVVEFNPDTAKSKIFDIKTVVEDMPEEELEEESASEEEKSGEKVKESEDKLKIKNEKLKVDKDNKNEKSKKDEAVGTRHGASDDKEKKDEKKKGKEEKTDEAPEEEEEKRKFNPKTEIELSDAKLIKKTAKIDDEIKMKLEEPEGYGRMAAQTAKQVIIQRLREAEREMIYKDFKEKEHEVVSGVVQRREGKIILIDLGKAVGVLPPDGMIQGERYNSGDRVKVYVKEVNSRPKGPEIVLSRTADEILKKIFYLEIPEISNGLIELKSVAREAGFRAKVAVWTDSDNVDPIGSCVGQRGARIQTVIAELGGEKVDIIQYDEEPINFISNALSPAKIIGIDTDEKTMKATVKVSTDQLSLAIGKGGQNARLAAKLTGWKIDIVEDSPDKKKDEKKDEKKEEDAENKLKIKNEKLKIDKDKNDKEDKKDGKKEKKEKVEKKEDKEDRKTDKKKKAEKKDEKKKKADKEKKDEKKKKDDEKIEKKKKDGEKEEKLKEEKNNILTINIIAIRITCCVLCVVCYVQYVYLRYRPQDTGLGFGGSGYFLR
ncbi:transcription termination/antitermination protein NusA [Candidatus Parcubacteria bacterium]|nr:transcription termination/antitermination protein NusA [Candidatus Parcubacteria bacterium]